MSDIFSRLLRGYRGDDASTASSLRPGSAAAAGAEKEPTPESLAPRSLAPRSLALETLEAEGGENERSSRPGRRAGDEGNGATPAGPDRSMAAPGASSFRSPLSPARLPGPGHEPASAAEASPETQSRIAAVAPGESQEEASRRADRRQPAAAMDDGETPFVSGPRQPSQQTSSTAPSLELGAQNQRSLEPATGAPEPPRGGGLPAPSQRRTADQAAARSAEFAATAPLASHLSLRPAIAEVSHRRRPAPAPAGDPTVQVRIGRVEVQAAPPAAPPPAATASPRRPRLAAPLMTLADYLDARREARR